MVLQYLAHLIGSFTEKPAVIVNY